MENIEPDSHHDDPKTDNSSTTDKMIKGSAAVAVITLITKMAGFLWKPLIGSLYGSTDTGNAFNFVFKISNRIYKAWEKLVWPSYQPVLTTVRKEDGDRAAWRFTSNLLSLQLLILLVG